MDPSLKGVFDMHARKVVGFWDWLRGWLEKWDGHGLSIARHAYLFFLRPDKKHVQHPTTNATYLPQDALPNQSLQQCVRELGFRLNKQMTSEAIASLDRDKKGSISW
jgi:hypothetical protein